MSITIDTQYLMSLAVTLDKFTKTGKNLWNCRCPYCGDSKKDKTKKRGYFYQDTRSKNGIMYRCHNCNKSRSLGGVLKDLNPTLYNHYRLAAVREKTLQREELNPPPTVIVPAHPKIARFYHSSIPKCGRWGKVNDSNLYDLSSLPSQHLAIQYVVNRKIPEDKWDLLHYTENYGRYLLDDYGDPRYFREGVTDKRLVIPFKRCQKYGDPVTFAMQGRTLEDSKIRYATYQLDKGYPLIYGAERLRTGKPVYVVEGPIDSLFLPNCIAATGLNMAKVAALPFNMIFIIDNEPKNKDVRESVRKLVDAGKKIFVWPRDVSYKDVNDCILGGMSVDDFMGMVDNNTYSGMSAKLKFSQW